MRCFVTGASGFLGANLVRELIARGHQVKVLVRAGGGGRGLAGLDVEHVIGDIRHRGNLTAAMRGCDWCFHAAASYHLWLRDYAAMYATNVAGTRAVIEAAVAAGCSRIVYTSTSGCIGLPIRIKGTFLPADESVPVSAGEMNNHYKRSKWEAELVAYEMASKGAPVVIVNPTAPAGPWDAKPTPTGQIIWDFLNGRMPAYLDTGLNWVHVRDVAVGHVLAAERGRVGDRYLLGNAEGNWTLKQLFAVLEKISGVPAPAIRIPYFLALAAAHVDEAIARATGKPPRASLAGVRMARQKMFFSPEKAIRELGLPQTPVRTALKDAVEWFRSKSCLAK